MALTEGGIKREREDGSNLIIECVYSELLKSYDSLDHAEILSTLSDQAETLGGSLSLDWAESISNDEANLYFTEIPEDFLELDLMGILIGDITHIIAFAAESGFGKKIMTQFFNKHSQKGTTLTTTPDNSGFWFGLGFRFDNDKINDILEYVLNKYGTIAISNWAMLDVDITELSEPDIVLYNKFQKLTKKNSGILEDMTRI